MNEKINIQVGNLVGYKNTIFRISHISVIGIDPVTGKNVVLPADELVPPSDVVSTPLEANKDDQDEILAADWATAESRFAIIKPLVSAASCGRADIVERAVAADIDPATIYRWIRKYKEHGLIALVPLRRGWTLGKHRIPQACDQVISQVMSSLPDAPTTAVISEVLRRCGETGIKPPSPLTVRARIHRRKKKAKPAGAGETIPVEGERYAV